MAKKSEDQKRIEQAMKTLLFEVLEFIAHVPMLVPFGDYADRFPRFKAKPADIDAAVARLVAGGVAQRSGDKLEITARGRQVRRLEDPDAVAFFLATS